MGFFRQGQPEPPIRVTVLVTGAAHGIGRASALALGARGYRLGLIDRDREPLDAVADDLRGRGVTVSAEAADVRDGEALRSAVAAFEQAVGPIDVVVACAGVGLRSTALDLNLEGFRLMLEVNVLGVARTIEAVLPGMFARKRGHIVGISSVTSFSGDAVDARLLSVEGRANELSRRHSDPP